MTSLGWVLRGVIVCVLLAAVGCGSSSGTRSAPHQVATPAGRDASIAVSELAYQPASGQTLGITLRRPVRPRALVVLVHGGGFRGGRRSDMTAWARMLTADGYATATIDYRLSGREPSQETALTRAAHDTTTALISLQSDAAVHRLPVVLWGYSAGALTVLRVAAANPAAARAVVSLAGYGEPAQIKGGDPPMLLFNGTADRVEPISRARATCRAARAVSVRCDQVVYPGATHMITPARAQDIHRYARRWLDSTL